MPIPRYRSRGGKPPVDRTQDLAGEMERVGERLHREGLMHIEALGGDIGVHRGVFVPIDELVTFLAEHLGDVKGKTVCDMGAGTGVTTVIPAERGANVTAVDDKQQCVSCTKGNARRWGVGHRVKVVQSDLFEELGGRKFDVIIFTPSPRSRVRDDPVTPVYVYENHALRFLEQAPEHLKEGGRILFMHSTYPALPGFVKTSEKIEMRIDELVEQQGFEKQVHEKWSKIEFEAMLDRFSHTRQPVASDVKIMLFELTKPS